MNRMRSLHLLVAVLLAAPLAAQDLPAPGDYRQAVERATGLYSEAMTAVSASIAAIQADDSLMLGLAVRQYRRVMTYLTVWHGRACWKADYEGANVAYPQQATMGEVLVTWGMARDLTTGTAREALRATLVQSLQLHARLLVETSQEMLNECTP